MSKGNVVPLPSDAPKAGEVYKHYKGAHGGMYRVVGMAIDTQDDSWVVIYEPLYENAVAQLFTRPLNEWREMVEWEGTQVERFTKI